MALLQLLVESLHCLTHCVSPTVSLGAHITPAPWLGVLLALVAGISLLTLIPQLLVLQAQSQIVFKSSYFQRGPSSY